MNTFSLSTVHAACWAFAFMNRGSVQSDSLLLPLCTVYTVHSQCWQCSHLVCFARVCLHAKLKASDWRAPVSRQVCEVIRTSRNLSLPSYSGVRTVKPKWFIISNSHTLDWFHSKYITKNKTDQQCARWTVPAAKMMTILPCLPYGADAMDIRFQ